MEAFILAFEIIGTIAFSASGAMTAVKKNMDIFGIIILGLVTAVGGGVMRDVVLNISPRTFYSPVYAIVSCCTSVFIFLYPVRRFIGRHTGLYDALMLIMDTVGLGVFTVVGVQTACLHNLANNKFLFVFVGVLTGVGGGVLRDVLAQNTPYIFVKHVYACASLAGALVCSLLLDVMPLQLAMLIGAAVVIIIRWLAAKFRWSLPHPKSPETSED